jgi:hypothetical protein
MSVRRRVGSEGAVARAGAAAAWLLVACASTHHGPRGRPHPVATQVALELADLPAQICAGDGSLCIGELPRYFTRPLERILEKHFYYGTTPVAERHYTAFFTVKRFDAPIARPLPGVWAGRPAVARRLSLRCSFVLVDPGGGRVIELSLALTGTDEITSPTMIDQAMRSLVLQVASRIDDTLGDAALE